MLNALNQPWPILTLFSVFSVKRIHQHPLFTIITHNIPPQSCILCACVRVCLRVCVRSFCWFWTVSQFLSDDTEPQQIVQATYVLAHECVGGSVCTHVCVVIISVLGSGQFLCSSIWCQLGETKEAQGGQFTVRGKSKSCFFCILFKGQNLATLYLAGLHKLPKKLQIQIFV